MDRDEFVGQVQTLAGLPDKAMAEQGTRIVFELVSRRLTGGEADDVLAQLPEGVKELWDPDTRYHTKVGHTREGQLEYQTLDELYSLVGNNLGEKGLSADPDTLTMAVLRALKGQLTQGQADDVAAQLPGDLERVWRGM